jgi:hypothetical protein
MYMPNFLDGFDRLVAFDAETTGKRNPGNQAGCRLAFAIPSAARTFLGPRGLRQPGEVHGPPPRLFLEKHSDRLRDPGIIPEIEPSHVLPRRVLDGEAGGMLDHAPRPRKTAGHFPGLHAALYEPNYHLRSFRTGHDPADLCRQHRRHHFGAEFVSFAGSEPPSHSAWSPTTCKARSIQSTI